MRADTPPPNEDDDEFSDSIPAGLEDIEIIEDSEIDGYLEEIIDDSLPAIIDSAKTTFCAHSGPVFCCDLDRRNRWAISGGQDDKAFIWNIGNGQIICEVKGHKDSVVSTSFNSDYKLIATGDMSGMLQVRNCSDFDDVTWEYEMGEDLTFLEWHHQNNNLLAGTKDGNCYVWDFPDGEFSGNMQVFHSSGHPAVCGNFLPDGSKTVIGYEDGSIRIWDLCGKLLHAIEGKTAHSGSVTVMDCHPSNNLILTGSIDGTAKLIKSNDSKALYTVCCEPGDFEQKSVEGIGFFSSQPLFATGTVNGSLAIWDMATQVRRLQYEQQTGISQLFCDPTRPMVYTSGIDGIVRLFDGRTGQEEKSWSGHTAAILAFKLSSCGTMILTASDDCTCKIFEIR